MKIESVENTKFDSLPEGLRMRDGIYYAEFRYQGSRFRLSLKTGKLALAKQRLKDAIVSASKGELSKKEFESPILTVDEWCREYELTHLITRVPRSQTQCVQILINEVVPYLGKTRPLDKVTTAQLIRMRSELWKDVTAATQNRKMVLVKHFFSEAKRRKLINDDPAKDVQKLQELGNPSRTLSEIELKRLFFACAEPLRTFVKLAAVTGMRLGELQNLRGKNLEFDNQRNLFWIKLINQDGFRTKSGQNRTIPLKPSWVPSLIAQKERTDPEELLFTPPLGGAVYNPRREWRRVIKKLGLKGFTFHGLRRSYGTLLHKNGTPLGTVQQLMGHASITQTRDYIDVHSEDLISSVGCIDKALDLNNEQEFWAQNGHSGTFQG